MVAVIARSERKRVSSLRVAVPNPRGKAGREGTGTNRVM